MDNLLKATQQEIRNTNDYQAFLNLNSADVGQRIDIEDLKTADNQQDAEVKTAVKQLYNRMIKADLKKKDKSKKQKGIQDKAMKT